MNTYLEFFACDFVFMVILPTFALCVGFIFGAFIEEVITKR